MKTQLDMFTPTQPYIPVIQKQYEVNPDGISIKGCNIIYAPKGQALEYAPLATNPYRGCGHKCVYCYVPRILNIAREEFDLGALPRKDFALNLSKDAKKYLACGITDQVMMSFTTDPYHAGNNYLTRDTILILQDHGMAVCTLTKGGSRALRDIELFRYDRDAFASTLTSIDDGFSNKWESGAAPASDRMATLRTFHDKGIFTWVSLEPTISAIESERVLIETFQYVDLYKIGKANYIKTPDPIDWREYTLRMIDICNRLNIKHYVKRDLQGYLPEGYHNPLRIEQHH